jgi:UDP-GlcNAc:undecaprenyl-phosphate GlcNAc-1-phosphate transferase
MTTVLLIFIAACLFTLVATPAVRKQALRFDLTDKPSARKIHERVVPRVGGVALFFGFFLSFGLLFLFRQRSFAAESLFADNRAIYFAVGAALIFLLGLLDDIFGLSSLVKFVGQLLVALLIYCWGFQITAVTIPFGLDFSLGIFSLPVTVFWFVLVINAINLVDGLDGLAAGICLFVSLSMLFVCTVNNQIASALAFAALAGALIGFLRYNFYPASIFMGDSGSYFLGYCLAVLSIAGTIKGEVTTAMLIPVIALGVPLIDTLWAPIRRFARGQNMFLPDNKHIHHRLVKFGFTHRRAVLSLYALTVILGICSMILVHARNDTSALILFVLGGGVIGLTRHLGESDFVSMRGVSSWARDLSDEAGISYKRRLFLNHQLEIARAPDIDSLWAAVCGSLEALEFDYAEFRPVEAQAADTGRSGRRLSWTSSKKRGALPVNQEFLLRIELPLHDFAARDACNFGVLLLMKDMRNEITGHYILKRVEQLRRSMVAALLKMS